MGRMKIRTKSWILCLSGVLCIAPRFAHCWTGNVADIVSTTLKARYIHAAFGLRYLPANPGELNC